MQPSLAPHASPSVNPSSGSDRRWLIWGCGLIVFVLFLRLAYLASGIIELSEDEAYQWVWSKHLALSYFSKPPMIAYAQWVGTSIWGDTVFGVRFLSPVLAAILSLLLLRFFAREVNARTGFFLILILTATPLAALGATLMTVDPLSVFFWTLTMLAGWRAIRDDATTWDWFWVGLWMGLGFLSKYTALFQWLCWAVLFVLWQPARKQLRRPGPYIALIVNFFCMLPVLIWNAKHDWVTVKHVAQDNAHLDDVWKPTLRYFFEFVGGEFGLLNPVFFAAICIACVVLWRKHRSDLRLVYFFSMGAPLFIVYLLFTLHSRVQLNWIAPSIVPLLCLMVVYWSLRWSQGAHAVKAWLIAGLVLGFAVVALMHDTDMVQWITGRPLPRGQDPLQRVRGWKEVGETVGEARQRLLSEGRPVFIIGNHYGITGQLMFNLPEARSQVRSNTLVYYQSSDRARNQFYFWPGYSDRKGDNAIYVRRASKPEPPPERLLQEFESVTDLGVKEILYHGRVLHTYQLFECRTLR